MSIELEGMDELLSSLEQMANTQQLKNTLGECCALVEAEAKAYAPKDTGALARSIQSKVEGDSSALEGIVFTPLEYAP